VVLVGDGGLFDEAGPDCPPLVDTPGGWVKDVAERFPAPQPKLMRIHEETKQPAVPRKAKTPIYGAQRFRTHLSYRLEPGNAPNAVPGTRQECPVREPDSILAVDCNKSACKEKNQKYMKKPIHAASRFGH